MNVSCTHYYYYLLWYARNVSMHLHMMWKVRGEKGKVQVI